MKMMSKTDVGSTKRFEKPERKLFLGRFFANNDKRFQLLAHLEQRSLVDCMSPVLNSLVTCLDLGHSVCGFLA
jgi:hypothetical protein